MTGSSTTILSQTRPRMSLAYKILFVAAISLVSGLFIVGGAALYLAKQELVSLQKNNSSNAASIICDEVKINMLANDAKKVDATIKELIENKRVLSLAIFNEKGEERGTGAKGNLSVDKAIQNGQAIINEKSENGIHLLETFIPLVNEERCKTCHNKDVKINGVLKLNSSI